MALVLGADEDSNGYLSTINMPCRGYFNQRHGDALRDASSEADIRSTLSENRKSLPPDGLAAGPDMSSGDLSCPGQTVQNQTHKKTRQQAGCFLQTEVWWS